MKRYPQTEAKLESVFSAVRAYASIAGHYDNIHELETRIARSWADTTKSGLTFDVVGSILGRAIKEDERRSRWGAWLAGRLFSGRATCVGNHVIQQRQNGFESPLVGQLQSLGLPTRRIAFKQFTETLRGYRTQRRIDGMLVNLGEPQITVIKTAVLPLRAPTEEPSLFNPRPVGKPSFIVPSSAITPLVIAEWVLRSSLPSVPVRCLMFLIDGDRDSREFFAFDTTGTYLQQLTKSTFDLSACQVAKSSCELRAEGVDLESLASCPDIVTRESLMKLPVDRATRAMMCIDALWSRQASRQGLSVMTAGELAKEVEHRFLINYTRDHQRHDLEDCLVNRGFIERPSYERKCYALTPIGVFQALLQRRLFQTNAIAIGPHDAEPSVLAPIRRQAKLWARYQAGEQIID